MRLDEMEFIMGDNLDVEVLQGLPDQGVGIVLWALENKTVRRPAT